MKSGASNERKGERERGGIEDERTDTASIDAISCRTEIIKNPRGLPFEM